MQITDELIDYVSSLARLALSDEEKEKTKEVQKSDAHFGGRCARQRFFTKRV